MVSYLTEELVGQGHDVTLFASADFGDLGKAGAMLRSPSPRPGRSRPLRPTMPDVRARPPGRPVRHPPLPYRPHPFPVFAETKHLTLTTLHGRQDLFDLRDFYQAFPGMPLVSISDTQRAPIPSANWPAPCARIAGKLLTGQ